jgi:hypothetical protein
VVIIRADSLSWQQLHVCVYTSQTSTLDADQASFWGNTPESDSVTDNLKLIMEIIINLANPAHLFLLALTVLVIMGSVVFVGEDFPPAIILTITLAVGGVMTIIFSIMAMVINAF